MMRMLKEDYDKVVKPWYDKMLGLVSTLHERIELDEGDVEGFVTTLTLWGAALADDTGRYGVKELGSIYIGIIHILDSVFECESVEPLFRTLKFLLNWLRKEGSYSELSPIFKEYGSLVTKTIKPVLPYLRNWRCSRDTESFDICHRWFMFPARMPLTNEALKDKTVVEYLSVERQTTLFDARNPVEQRSSSKEIRRYITSFFSRWTPWDLKEPRWSGGSTADQGSSPYRKIDGGAMPLKTFRWVLNAWTRNDDLLHSCMERGWFELLSLYTVVNDIVPSKLHVVPKNALAMRTINMEPNSLSMWQTAVSESIYKCKSFPTEHFDPTKQWRNQVAAVQGSKDKKTATIDLSQASDRVTRSQVSYFWSEKPSLKSALFSTRSDFVSVVQSNTVTIHKLNAFAAMGSKNCYPVEGSVFLAAAFVACDRANCGHDDVLVMGDDIIIPTEAVPYFYDIALEQGWIVNKDKSYSGNECFRESCGVYACNGRELCPIQVSRLHMLTLDPKKLDDWDVVCRSVDWCNENLLSGKELSRYIVLRTMMAAGVSVPTSLPPLSIDKETEWGKPYKVEHANRLGLVLFSFQEENYSTRKYNSGLLVTTPSVKVKIFADEAQALQVWLYNASYLGRRKLVSSKDDPKHIMDCFEQPIVLDKIEAVQCIRTKLTKRRTRPPYGKTW